MALIDARQEVPLSTSGDGTLRVRGTRVSLDSIVHHYELGATAEEIALRFPALNLADVHSCLAYYLTHRDFIAEYLEEQRHSAKVLQERISADPAQQQALVRMRERIRKRAESRARRGS